nr:hypothetical protein Iba_chr14bCG0710 [Ipomoea batatas]
MGYASSEWGAVSSILTVPDWESRQVDTITLGPRCSCWKVSRDFCWLHDVLPCLLSFLSNIIYAVTWSVFAMEFNTWMAWISSFPEGQSNSSRTNLVPLIGSTKKQMVAFEFLILFLSWLMIDPLVDEEDDGMV